MTTTNTRKASMKSQKSFGSNVEYALIDMEATQAIQRAGREHAQTRVDNGNYKYFVVKVRLKQKCQM
jgi:hypothetical protein